MALLHQMPVEEARDQINARCFAVEAEAREVYSVEEHENLRIYEPGAGSDYPLILFMHGGAWVGGNLDTHDRLARFLCQQTPAVVVSVDYTNPPEGKFPLPLNECYDALAWAVQQVPHNGKVAVAGDSAGGNLAAALALLARDRGGPRIDFQLLINPALDFTRGGEFMRWQASLYLQNPSDAHSPYASPLLAENLRDLPPALILVAEHDELRGEGEAYAQRLIAAGVPTQVFCQMGANHLAYDGAAASEHARPSLEIAIGALRRALYPPGGSDADCD